MSKFSKTVKCPNCHTSVAWLASNQFKPFCSERCKMIDFGEWIMEEKVIPGDLESGVSDSDELN